MVKSTSCLKIITCGSDSAEKDDLDVSEDKGSSDKRGWSFRKRSVRHRVLSNTVISETPSSGNKESLEAVNVNYQQPVNTNVPEKISVIQSTDEKPQLSTSADPKVIELSTSVEPKVIELSTSAEPTKVIETVITTENESKLDVYPEESVVIVIQSAIRVFLGRRMLLKIKNVVKLQAAVRRHLVRNHAVGTLRCVQAIVKMQALVRARRSRLTLEGSYPESKLGGKLEKDNDSSKTWEKEKLVTKSNVTYTSIEKLLSNRFARQLLESAPKTKSIHVKCDPSKPDSAWKWLERWMSVSSPNIVESNKAEPITEQQEREQAENLVSHVETIIPCEVFPESKNAEPITEQQEREKAENLVSHVETIIPCEVFPDSKNAEPITEQQEREKAENLVSHVETNIPCEVFPESKNAESNDRESLVPSESEENLITYDPHNFEFQAYNPTSSLSEDDLEQPRPESTSTSDLKETLLDMISPPILSTQADSNSQVEFNSLPVKPETETEQPKRSMKRFASEQLDTEEKKFVFGSRKPSNPAFISAHSKFEELSTTANSGGSISSAHQDAEVESHTDTILSGANTVIRTKELGVAENSTPLGSRAQVGGSECGTELSISSTLDSPDRSEVGATECEHEAKVLEEGICYPDSMKNIDVESKDESTVSISKLSPFVLDKPDELGDVNGESVNLVVAMDTPPIEPKLENDASDLQRQLDSETGHQPYRSSSEASPRSHITMPESHGTPSSQVSVKAKRIKSDKSGSNQKLRSLSGGKKSPSNPNHDSGSRGSMERLPQDQKNGKRRNSFGATRPDPIDQDQEPAESNTNSSLPHFMQATESARAKLQANNSPRSSPDVQDRDIYTKKRHSLPGANGRQGSPRVQRSMSQALQSVKGNGNYQHERKWQR